MIYQFLVLGKMDFLDPGTLSRGGGSRTPTGLLPLKSAVQEFEKEYIARALKQNRQQKKQVAQILGMDRKTLFRKIKRYGLD
jgi:DNA-binding NtrC family response regulator